MIRNLVLCLTLLGALIATPAQALDDEGYDLPKVELKRIPPQFSWEVGAQIGFGEITYWRDQIGWWGTLGFFGAWGRHFGLHRIGMGLGIVMEGPAPVHMSFGGEPQVRWDWVHNKVGLYLGAAVGPTFFWHHAQTKVVENDFRISPMGSFRIGWSQPWTRVGRRLFFAVESKLRYVRGAPNPTFAIMIGSGRGY